jgi:hypothetical protein
MGEARRRLRLGSVELVRVDRKSTKGGWLLPEGDAGAFLVEIGVKGAFSREECRASADWVSRAAPQKPGALVVVAVGGFEDDPRQVVDIPEALEAFRWFGERLREIDEGSGRPDLLNRLDSNSATILKVAMGLRDRNTVRIVGWDDPTVKAQNETDRARIDALDQTITNQAATTATKEPKQ